MYDIYDNDFDKKFDEAVDALEKKEHRLIYADKLKAHYSWWKGGSREMTMDEAKSDFDVIIDLQPTVEAEPIKHGYWIDGAICSVCGELATALEGRYCENCGAKMDGGENER